MKWFKHDANMRNDTKLRRVINKFGLEGYGLYNLIVESIVESIDDENPMPLLEETIDDIASFYNTKKVRITEMIDYMISQKLFETVNNRISCMKVYKHLQSNQTRSNALRNLITNFNDNKELMYPSLTVSDVCEEETRLEETRLEETESPYILVDPIIEHFNITTGQNRRFSKTSREPISARLNDGFTEDNAKTVISKMYKKWKDDPKMKEHITIETLFRPSNFEKYLNSRFAVRTDDIRIDNEYDPTGRLAREKVNAV